MIDIHSHVLPGIDDGAPNLEVALRMARIAVADGIRVMACTPHITPGVYYNTSVSIHAAIDAFRLALIEAEIPLTLVAGADAQIYPELLGDVIAGKVPTLNGGRYFLLEPPHHVAPPRFKESVQQFIDAGYVPIITHPERLTWINGQYPMLKDLVKRGAWMQVTAASLLGQFGVAAERYAMRMLKDGLVHVIASDAHSDLQRKPEMRSAFDLARVIMGDLEADQMVNGRPSAALRNAPHEEVAMVPYLKGIQTGNALKAICWRTQRQARSVLHAILGR